MPYEPAFRTDLALEAADTGDGELPSGVHVEETTRDGVHRTTVRIESEEASKRLGRPRGRYVTLESDMLCGDELLDELSRELSAMLPEGTVLIVGLGNSTITPDALGPATVQDVIATRHISPEQISRIGLPALRPVCALAPGAMGQTGLETATLIAAITKKLDIAVVVAVDALAARSMTRLGRTVQLSDSGIAPGAGVLNRRAELSRQTLGIPVLSLGIPTVVDARTLLADFAPDSAISPAAQDLIVTPRDVDRIVAQGAKALATALNRALFPLLTSGDIEMLMA